MAEDGHVMIDESTASNNVEEPLGKSSCSSFNPTVTLPLLNGIHHLDCFSIHDLDGMQILIPPLASSPTRMKDRPTSSLLKAIPEQSNTSGNRVNLWQQCLKDEYQVVCSLMKELYDDAAPVSPEQLMVDSSELKSNNIYVNPSKDVVRVVIMIV